MRAPQPLAKRAVRYALIAVCGAALLLFALMVYSYLNARTQAEQMAFARAQEEAEGAIQQIETRFGSLMEIAQSMADDLTNGQLAYQDVESRMRFEVSRRPDIDGIAVAFEPFAYDPQVRLYQVYLFQNSAGGFEFLRGATYDYTRAPDASPEVPKTAWYHNPLKNGAMWNEPFFATGAQKVLIEYGVPFYRADPQSGGRIPGGVVTIDYSLTGMASLVNVLDLGATGYGMVLSAGGIFLAHPLGELIGRATIFDLAETLNDKRLQQWGERALRGETFSEKSVDPVTGQTSWLFFMPIPKTGWRVGLVLNAAEFAPDARATIREQIGLALTGGGLAFLLAGLALRVDRGDTNRLWAWSFTFALVCVGVIVMAWTLSTTLHQIQGVGVADRASVMRYVESATRKLESDAQPPILIPTGILVQAAQFPDARSVTINGYIWQRYHKDVGESIPRGFALPQRIGEEATLEEIARRDIGEDTVIVWYMGVTLVQTYDPTRFPFDNREIAIRITPIDPGANVMLVPDLDSYALLNPALLPGVDRELTINSWRLENSAFSYRTITTNTTVGLRERNGITSAPTLYYTISARRDFLGPFIVYVVPALMVALLTFAFLAGGRKGEAYDEIVTTLTYSASLFFVLVVAHTGLRDTTAAVGLTYLEHLYVLLHVAIVGVAINTYLAVKMPTMPVISYRNNIVVKLLYWPTIAGIMLISTLYTFILT